ncbi:MAG TPA: hypothetical protein VHB73_00060 [Alphaproteobacteria bacterium]|nr:hypothetical protein [Alphaproteobacteria bacterium]
MSLSRRHFLSLAAVSGVFACVPMAAQALVPSQIISAGHRGVFWPPAYGNEAWAVIETADHASEGRELVLEGHVKHLPSGEAVFSRQPYHCDYCYLGHTHSLLRVEGMVPAGPQKLRGVLRAVKDKNGPRYALTRAVAV